MSDQPKRQLSHAEISNCENATQPRCDCRCGGALHGANRIAAGASASAYEALPADDPHHLQTVNEKRVAKRSRSRARRRQAFLAEKTAFLAGMEERRIARLTSLTAAAVVGAT